MPGATDDAKLKEILKIALVEVLEERRDLISDALTEAIEDLAMARAIQEGLQSEDASRSDVLAVLQSPK